MSYGRVERGEKENAYVNYDSFCLGAERIGEEDSVCNKGEGSRLEERV